ncbi:TPA: threonine--tRNA ligase [Candidatus Poribacteria bacterium]|nr:threonine--tRNA ligase [Candidatus Poribacteria bacterium]HEX28692.1 threonine--tRNA ligase [Candidatus Poribacteria bacterium]
MVKISFPDGSSKEYPKGITPLEIASDIGPGLAKAALAALVNGELVDLTRPITSDAEVRILTFRDEEGRRVYRHSASHVMAQAVKELFPEAKLGIGPAIEDGFYYDFDVPKPFTPDDLERIEERMRQIIKADYPFKRREVTKDEAIRLFEEMGEIYKVELLNEMEDEIVSLYEHDKFVDLCRGPHLPSTGKLKVVKLLSAAGAYWRGDESRKMLQRIYGTAYERKSDLDAHLRRIEEAERRDHRRLGKQLDLFSFHEVAGAGLVYRHPKGAMIRKIIEDFWRDQHIKGGYEFVYTPHIGRSWLWETSGHLDFFSENMYSPMDVDGQNYYLKPMNCPFHIMIYKTRIRSYRDLPLRWAELGTVYRYERGGVLHGLMRVRGFTQDDAHIFCTPEQIEGEILRVLRFSLEMLRSFGFDQFEVYLSTKPEKAVGEPERWEQAQNSLRKALEAEDLPFEVDEGGGAFYGPKIDIKIKDAIGRSWQCSTIQFDFNLPERFDLSYVGEDGKEHRPYMVHRALLGSLERFFGVLIEHYAGAFPIWLAPVQVRVMNITRDQEDYALQITRRLKEAGLRADNDIRGEKLGYKVREAQLEKIPYMLIVGAREKEDGTVAVRTRRGEDLGGMKVEDFIRRVKEEIESKATYP